MLGITDQVQFQLFFKAVRVLISRIVSGRLFQVREPATWKARSPILVLVLGTKTSDDVDDRSRDLLAYNLLIVVSEADLPVGQRWARFGE